MEHDDWHALLGTAYRLALTSPDPSTQIGCILIDSDMFQRATGVNCLPRGVIESNERWERPLKYKIVEHAERNAIYQAASRGIATRGLTMVCTWACCCDCARAIIQAGITRLVTHKQAGDRATDAWKADVAIAMSLLKEAGVEVIFYDGEIGAKPVRHTGVLWNP